MKEEIINKLVSIINRKDYDEKDIVNELNMIVEKSNVEITFDKESSNLNDLCKQNLINIENNKSEDLIKTGFQNFDKTYGGFANGELIIVGGRPSMGKTQFLVNLSLNISNTHPVLYFTYDLSKDMLAARYMSCLTKIPAQKIIYGNLNEAEKDILQSEVVKKLLKKIYINNCYNNSVTGLKFYCRQEINRNDIKVIVIDYLQMMSSVKYKNREGEISYVIRELKSFAKENNICIIVSSQLNREVEKRGSSRMPYLADIRESGAIEQDADKVIFLYRPEYYGLSEDTEGLNANGLMKVIIAKNRMGKTGILNFISDLNFTGFRDYDDDMTFEIVIERLNELKK